MRFYLSLLAMALVSGLFFNSSGIADELTGRQVMEKQRSFQTVETEYGEERMLLLDVKTNTKEKRQVKRYAKKSENGLNRYLVVFLAPADIRGTALLIHEQENEDDQWMYMPAVKKMQRIASASKRSYFMGTDFTYEDLEQEKIDQYTYTILRTETIDTPPRQCHVIEAVPLGGTKKSSGYSRRILWVDQQHFFTLKIEFFDRRNRLIKTQKSFEWENITGTVYRPRKTIMDHHRKHHKTLTLMGKRELTTPIADQVFTERFILSEKHFE